MSLRDEYVKYTGNGMYCDDGCAKKTIKDYLIKDTDKKQLFEIIQEILEYMDYEEIIEHRKRIGCNNYLSVGELKLELESTLLDLFEKQCDFIGSIFNVSYNVIEPLENEPDDFKHCVCVTASYDISYYNSMW